MNGVFLRRVLVQAWNAVCVHPLSAAPRTDGGNVPAEYVFRVVPWLGALAALAALLAGKILAACLPGRAATLIFAAAALFVSEWRTSGRGLALLVSTLDGISAGKAPAAVRSGRLTDFRALNGLVALLLVLLIGGGKFAAYALAFHDGCPWFAGTALTAAFTIESYFRCRDAASLARPPEGAAGSGAVILVSGGFLLLWSFVFRALPTLAGTLLAVAAVYGIAAAARKRGGRMDGADVMLAGYLGEFLLLLAALVFL